MSDEAEATGQQGRRSGWLGRFVALFVGVPPVAVWAAEEEDAEAPSDATRD